MHKLLQIVRGVAPAPGDSASNERGVVVLDLMNENGLMLDPAGGWTPKIAGTDGVWAENPLVPGRRLIGGEDGNVVETMRVSIGGDRIAAHITALNRMMADAREFWSTERQIEPVYLKWEALGAPGPQYALIYNITFDLNTPSTTDITGPIDITLSIEREPYWRALPPGTNPKIWHMEQQGQPWDYNDLNLLTGTNHFAVETITNRCEWDDISRTVLRSRNYVEIDGRDISGDAPALALITIVPGANTHNRFLVGRNTKPLSRSGIGARPQVLLMGVSDGGLPFGHADTASVGDTGATWDPPFSENRRVEVSFATETDMHQRWQWGSGAKSINVYRGRYAVFIRARQDGGSSGNVTMRLHVGANEDFPVITPTVSPVVQSGSGNTTEWPVTYMGTIDIPNNGRTTSLTYQSAPGTGLTEENVIITLEAARSTGSAKLYICDLLLLPIDEPSFDLKAASDVLTGAGLADNTGYSDHGGSDEFATILSGTHPASEFSGQMLTLLPGEVNRVYVFAMDITGLSDAQTNNTVRINIIPRWRGVRDA